MLNEQKNPADTSQKDPATATQNNPKPFVLPLAPQPRRKWPIVVSVLGVVLLIALGGGFYMLLQDGAKQPQTATISPVVSASVRPSASPTASPQLDLSKNYGDKYANGLLPVGDGKYSTTSAQKGSIYACKQYATNLTSDKGGAETRGPWFTNNNTQYDTNKKAHVSGKVAWQGTFANTVNGATRTITTNDLPQNHTTGTFPVQASDAAYAYDRNPNTIRAQSLAYALSANPQYGQPQCMGGEVGVMLTGVALFNGFDAGGRDAGAWEVQDDCSGHPQNQGEYHYHTLSSCIKDVSVKTVIGFALDGFPITGPQISPSNILTTNDLDECHGGTSPIMLDGKQVTMYHYVMTEDFPYSVSCFRATAATPPGQPR